MIPTRKLLYLFICIIRVPNSKQQTANIKHEKSNRYRLDQSVSSQAIYIEFHKASSHCVHALSMRNGVK